jgi:hypothetical protein
MRFSRSESHQDFRNLGVPKLPESLAALIAFVAGSLSLHAAKFVLVDRTANIKPAPLRPNERMARAGLFHPDFMDKVKSKTIATWKRKAAGESTAECSPADNTKLLDTRNAGWHLVFQDDFDRKELGDKWKIIDGKWSLADGSLTGSGTLMINSSIYTPKPLDESAYRGYQAGPRQYNPRIMD